MAHLHTRRTVYKSGGSKAKDRVEYITRESAKDLQADRQVRYIGRADREDLVYTNSRNLPAWAHGNPVTYFRAAEQYERANGNAFEEWKITLPQELTPRQNMDLMRDLVETIAGDRLPITYAFHCPKTMDGTQEQPHLHLLLSGRQDDGMTRTPAQHFKRYNPAHPARGGAQKDPALNHLRAVKAWRVTISDVVNLHLERVGCAARIHPDRLDERELSRTPEPKLLPSESRTYRERGEVSDTMAAVLDIRAQRKATHRTEQANARAYWEERKTVLGLTDEMDGTAQLAAVARARAQVRDQAPARLVAEGYVGVEPDDRALGDLAREAVAQAWDDAQNGWGQVEAHALCTLGWEAVRQARDDGRQGLAQVPAPAVPRPVEREDQGQDLTARWAMPLLGNRVSKMYHTPGHKNYGEVHPKNQVRFWTEHDAIEAGFRRALNDHYGPGSGQPMTEEEARQLMTGEDQGSHAGWSTLEHELRALTQQLDALSAEAGGTGQVRIRLWDREPGLGLA